MFKKDSKGQLTLIAKYEKILNCTYYNRISYDDYQYITKGKTIHKINNNEVRITNLV